ncbi:MAG: phenylalanine--tRNA ligase subunit beta [Planctomycetes bacterium]|nr:phenylalanine--tRNA ligase subunit beta [Planctomycetota bacterium]
MKTTTNWLNSLLKSSFTEKELNDALTLSGTEVEHVTPSPDGSVLQLEITSNRVDCLGVRGLAREVAAVKGLALELPSAAEVDAQGEGLPVEIEADAIEACPHYTGRIIRGVKVGPSPDWLKQRLEAIGVTPVNNLVDITNYVLFEYSQPLHAFDLGKLKGGIVVRKAEAGEKFLAINHKTYELCPDDLVIADQERAVALAGVMGGADSEISGATTDVLLESAYFAPRGIKATGRRMDKQHSENLDSDSRYRFERGVDPAGAIAASNRAIELILEIPGGRVEGPISEAGAAADPWLRTVELRSASIERTLGSSVDVGRVQAILQTLGLRVEREAADAFAFGIPSFRRDLEREIDLVEEIGRVVGLGAFESRLILPIASARPEPFLEDRQEIAAILRGAGVNEVVTDTFVADKGSATLTPWPSGPALRARSPINTHWPCIRRSLMPSLARILGENLSRNGREILVFEQASLTLTNQSGEPAPLSRNVVALAGPDFFVVKGAIETLLSRLGVHAVEWKRSEFGLFSEGEAAELWLEGRVVGFCGLSSSTVQKEYQLARPIALAELDTQALVDARQRVSMFKPLARFPAVKRDLAIVVEDAVLWADIEGAVRALNTPHLRGLEFFDEFRGKQIPAGKKSLAFAMVFRDEERTLVSSEVDEQVSKIIEALKATCGAEIRA